MTNPIEVAARALIPYSGASTNRELQARKTFESIDVDDLAAVILAHYQRSDGLDVTAFETAEAVKAHLTGKEQKGAEMTIPQAAVDAAAERFDAGPGFDVSILARYALEAATPHIRTAIVEEIRLTDRDPEAFSAMVREYSVDYANGYYAAIEDAAQIAEGYQK